MEVSSEGRRPLIFVVGATSSGKSELSLQLAEKFNGVILNCDSVQVYKDLDIGSAKPTSEDYQRVPHFLYDFVSAPEELALGKYLRRFEIETEKIETEKICFVVGGTGFYFQGIEKGLLPVQAVRPEIMAEVMTQLEEQNGAELLYAELKSRDPIAAEKISINDHYRLARAVEILRSSSKTLSEIRQDYENKKPTVQRPILKIGLAIDKEALSKRIHLRTKQMLKLGLVEEVQSFIDQGLENWAPLSSVGYKQTVEMIRFNRSLSWLQEEIELRTRQLAKKQRTWFKRDSGIYWLESIHDVPKGEKLVKNFLKSTSELQSLDLGQRYFDT